MDLFILTNPSYGELRVQHILVSLMTHAFSSTMVVLFQNKMEVCYEWLACLKLYIIDHSSSFLICSFAYFIKYKNSEEVTLVYLLVEMLISEWQGFGAEELDERSILPFQVLLFCATPFFRIILYTALTRMMISPLLAKPGVTWRRMMEVFASCCTNHPFLTAHLLKWLST